MQSDPVCLAARFGFGVGAWGGGDREALWAEFAAGEPAPAGPLATAADGLAAEKALREARRARGAAAAAAGVAIGPEPGLDAERAAVRAILASDRIDALSRGIGARYGFRERLVAFWCDHFTVSVRQPGCRTLAGAFLREAIAPHVDGRFSDMLLAAMRHPAMLRYLDNEGSVGPDSPVGLRTGRGLNENLARECLELHTVGVASGYTQADVTAFAAILTGWSVQRRDPPFGFRFAPRAHQPGGATLLGVSFPPGEEGGIEALAFLADHPATHRHLATKLVRHFGSDRPDPGEVRMVEATLRDTRGDLAAAARALLGLPSARRPGSKFRSPLDLVLASCRALGLPAGPAPDAAAMLAALGQPLFEAPLPNGWPDTEADWLGPEAMVRRVDFAWALSGHADPSLDPGALARSVLGGALRPGTAFAIDHAGSRREAVALLLASPEFQRR